MCMRMRKRGAGGSPWPPPRLADIPARMNAGPHLDLSPPTPLQLAPEFSGAQRLQHAHIALIFLLFTRFDSTRGTAAASSMCADVSLPAAAPVAAARGHHGCWSEIRDPMREGAGGASARSLTAPSGSSWSEGRGRRGLRLG
jgi:hypothetical protein